ncbi:MAG: hypothetical protein JST54_30310 [Deltaproteobacteria bacterium]|nr:hypothetical protein [Deltaproteobacteria bacterium]
MMDTPTHPTRVELPEELLEQLQELVEQLRATPMGQLTRVDRSVALRIALARGIEALHDETQRATE